MTNQSKTKVLLKGPILSRSGYGEQARFALRALRSEPDLYDIHIIPTSWGQTSWIPEDTEERRFINDGVRKHLNFIDIKPLRHYDLSLQVTIPNEFERLSPLHVGYTAGIETDAISTQWARKCNEMVDKIIVVSAHSKKVMEDACFTASRPGEDLGAPIVEEFDYQITTPITAVGYPVRQYDTSIDLGLGKAITTSFNFLCVAQMGPRKNLPDTIKWFVEEFHDDDVGLIVKTNLAKNCEIDRRLVNDHLSGEILSQYPSRKCKVYLLHGDMTNEEMGSLYADEHVHAFVCLSHGEGFGLPFFEAAYSGIPVVTVDYSGQRDYLRDENDNAHFYQVSYELAPVQPECVWEGVIESHSRWAFPTEMSSKEQMRLCYEDVIKNEGIAAKCGDYAHELRERYEETKMYEEFLRALDPQYKIEEKYDKFLEFLDDEED